MFNYRFDRRIVLSLTLCAATFLAGCSSEKEIEPISSNTPPPAAEPAPPPPPDPTVPRPAPALTFTTPSGSVDLAKYKGKVVALAFLLTTCPHCQHTSEVLEENFKKFGGRGFEPLGVAIDEGAAAQIPQFISEHGLTFPVGTTKSSTAHEFLQVPIVVGMMMPQLVFLDRQGVIQAQYSGDDTFFMAQEANIPAKIEEMLGPGSKK